MERGSSLDARALALLAALRPDHPPATVAQILPRDMLGVSLPQLLEGCVTKFASHKALKLIAWGKLTLDERVALHRVGRPLRLELSDRRETITQRRVLLAALRPDHPPATAQGFLAYKKYPPPRTLP